MIPRGVHKADMVKKKNICATFCPRTAKTEEPFFLLPQLLISPQAIYHFQGIAV